MSCGVTPTAKTPAAISTAINTIYTSNSSSKPILTGTFTVTLDLYPAYKDLTTVSFGKTLSSTPIVRIRRTKGTARICVCVAVVNTSSFQYVAVNWNNNSGNSTFEWALYSAWWYINQGIIG